jgi:catechol 2,3-dioxygenase-like lactoylglutathione lyase family enzyme
MPGDERPAFRGGRNIALKVPPHQFEATVAFYRDTLGLPHLGAVGGSETFGFGEMRLWVDPVPAMSQAELWLEVETADTTAAARRLRERGVVRCDEVEPLPAGLDGFWISSPCGIVHLVVNPAADPEG